MINITDQKLFYEWIKILSSIHPILCIYFNRYVFRNNKRVGLKDLGPRFTLKLRSLQKGTFDSKYGEYEWVHKVRVIILELWMILGILLLKLKIENTFKCFFLLLFSEERNGNKQEEVFFINLWSFLLNKIY